MELHELRAALRRNWIVAALAFLVCLVPGVLFGVLPAETYAARARLAVESTPRADGPTPVQQTNFLIPAAVAKIESRSLRERAAVDVPADLRRAAVAITVSADGGVIDVRGEGRRPAAVAAWVNAVTTRAIAETPADSPLRLVLVDEARPPRAATAPKPVPILFSAAVMGLIAAVFAAIAAARVRASFDRSRLVRERLGTSVLGEIPSVRGLRSGRQALLPWLAGDAPPELAEAFTALRTNAEFRLARLDAATVVVTSYQPAAGKSTVSAGLAWAMAAIGHDTVLLDADLRRPSVHDKVGSALGAGLADMGRVDPAALVQPTGIAHLAFVAAGQPDGPPADIVAHALPRALDHLDSGERRMRRIVIDAPPVAGVPETSLVVAAGRHVILVLDAKTVELPELAEAMARLQDEGAVILGVVVNRVRSRAFRRRTGSASSPRRPGRSTGTGRRAPTPAPGAPDTEPAPALLARRSALVPSSPQPAPPSARWRPAGS